MKNYTRTLLTLIAIMVLAGCGQKGPLIIDLPSASTNTGEPTSREVTNKDSVLNTQTEEISPTR